MSNHVFFYVTIMTILMLLAKDENVVENSIKMATKLLIKYEIKRTYLIFLTRTSYLQNQTRMTVSTTSCYTGEFRSVVVKPTNITVGSLTFTTLEYFCINH